MFSRFFLTAVLAVIASAVGIETACAQLPFSRQGAYIDLEQQRRAERYGSPSYSQPAFVTPSVAEDTNRSFYPSNDQNVHIHIVAPADAKITFDGTATRQTGTRRDYQSPALETGFRYSYEIQATWMEQGKQVTQRRNVPVQPGDDISLSITRDFISVNRAP